jgi:hypothetical protein
MPNAAGKKTCFVVMGFGEKTDYQSNPQRVLNLDRTYEDIIEPAVTASGLECIRADKIIHSGLIDTPMYEQLLEADLVIADLSTSNANAIYELGVRHALRPRCTIVMADSKFAFPFDLSHLTIAKYEHLGHEIGFRTVMDMRKKLQDKIAVILQNEDTDSPVFAFLPRLFPNSSGGRPAAAPAEPPKDDRSFADLLTMLKEAKADIKEASDWLLVAKLATRLRKLQPDDPYVIQQLALATYKSKHPDALKALQEAKGILGALGPDTSSDAETIGLWGAIHKRLWEVGKDPGDLNTATRAYARGYFIKDDYYNGINFAFLLNVRANELQGDEAIADRVVARRIRTEVLTLCDAALVSRRAKIVDGQASDERTRDELFWIEATKVEALLGLGREAESTELRSRIVTGPPKPADWMVESLDSQLAKLSTLNP